MTDWNGQLVAILVNYACHATTLAFRNTLISPDFAGAMREEITRATGAPCIFAQGACGDLGPRYSYMGDAEFADQNGRWLAYAALATLESMGPPATDYQYLGPVVSGATLGVWEHASVAPERAEEASIFEGGIHSVDLPLKPKPEPDALQQEKEQWESRSEEAKRKGDTIAARDYAALAERARRWLARLDNLPEGKTYSYHFSVFRLGDAIWVTCGGEPYNVLQTELRSRFPDTTILLSPLSGEHSVAYLLPRDRYGQGLYQEEPSILAAGCLERVTEAIADRVEALL